MTQPKASAVVKRAGLRSVEYEITGFVKSRDRRSAVRNQLYDLVYRQLSASDSLRHNQAQSKLATRESAALYGVTGLRMLGEEDRAELERHMRLSSYPAGSVIQPQNVVPDALLIIESGVVTAAVERPDGWHELGRLGPGELMGENGIIDDTAIPVRCMALTDCVIYRIDRSDLAPWLHEHSELRAALAGLARFRNEVRATALQHKPATPTPKGFLQWLRKNVTPPPSSR